MHVCHFCDLTFEGEFFRLMITGLAARGVRVSLVELAPGKPPTWLADVPEVSYQSLNVTSKLQYPNAVRKIAKFVKRENVDILHTHLYFAGVLGVMTKWLQRRAVVVVMRHHSSIVRLLGWGVHIAADRWMAEKADHIIAVSDETRQYMFETDKIRRDQIDVVNIGFDFEKLTNDSEGRARVRSEFGFQDDDLVIGYVATLVPGKGHVQLIEAFGRILKDVPRAKLLFVGGGSFDDVRVAAERMPEGVVVFTGWRDDVNACLNAMDIFVLPSLSEAFSRVLIEAMAVGLPVIATRVGGAADVIKDGETGILIEPGDIDAICNETVRLYRDPNLRKSLGRRGRDSVRGRFTAKRMVDAVLALYQKWMGSRA